ncbi:MAG: tetratricopeptide repeat protein, partial [Desulfuromonadaceae bacterium]
MKAHDSSSAVPLLGPSQVQGEDPVAAGALYIESRLLALEGDVVGSLRLLQEAVRLDPHDPFLRYSLAENYLALGQLQPAIRATEDAVIQDPEFVEAHFLLGNLFFHVERNDKAIQSFLRVLELDPEREDVSLMLAITHARNDEYDRAVEIIKKSIKDHPESTRSRFALARMYQKMDLVSLAIETYQNLLKQNPESEAVYFELGGLYEERGDLDRAEQIYRQFLALDDNEVLEQEDWSAAAESFDSILQQRPDLDQARFYLGIALERDQKFQGALEVFSALPEDSELYPDALAHQGYLHHRLGQTDQAIAALEKLIAGGDDRAELWIYLASLYQDLGRFEVALETIDRGLRVSPQDVGLLYHRGLTLESGQRR